MTVPFRKYEGIRMWGMHLLILDVAAASPINRGLTVGRTAIR